MTVDLNRKCWVLFSVCIPNPGLHSKAHQNSNAKLNASNAKLVASNAKLISSNAKLIASNAKLNE